MSVEHRANGHVAAPLALTLPPEIVEAVAVLAADLVAERLAEAQTARPEPYMGVEAAAEYLACPKSRIYALASAGRIPLRRDGSRLLFRASELDEWLEHEGGGIRP